MTRHSSSTSSSSWNLTWDSSSPSCSSSPAVSPTPAHDNRVPLSANVCTEWEHKLALKQPDSNLSPLPLPPSQAQLLFHPKSTKLSSSQSFIRRRWKSVSAGEGEDPFVLALKACTSREEEDKHYADMLKGGKASYGGLHTMFMGLLKPGQKTYEAPNDAKSANPLLNLLQFATSKKKQVVQLSDLLGCKTTHLHVHVVHPSLIYRKRRFKPSSLPM